METMDITDTTTDTKWRYIIPEKVKNCFYDKITSVTYNNCIYNKSECYFFTSQGLISDDVLKELLVKYENIQLQDFIEEEEPNKEFESKIKKLKNALSEFDYSKLSSETVMVLTIYNTNYNENLNFVCFAEGEIYLTNTTVSTGIKNDIIGLLINRKKNIMNFEYSLKIVSYEYNFEKVWKYYIYDDDVVTTNSTGAGELTSWMTHEELEKRLDQSSKQYIVLNSSFRFKKGN